MCEKSLLPLCLVMCLVNAAPPSFITKCKSDDPKCVKESSQVALPIFAKGLPEYNVEQLDPVVFTKVDASTPNLKFVLNDVTLTGLSQCKIKKAQRDVANSKIDLKFLCEAKLDGNYEMKGQVLVLPIEGKGKMYVNLKTTQINLVLNIEDKKGDDGKIHWHIKSWNHSFELKDKSDVNFENLFDGNEVLAQAAKELFKTSGNDIIREIGAPMIKTTVARVVDNIQQFFKANAMEYLSVD